MRVLVTGAAGFIGSHLCDRLLAEGHEVVGIDNVSTGRRENVPGGLHEHSLIAGTITAAEQMAYVTDGGVDLIIHCAASYDDRDKWHRDTDTNVQGSINVGIAARQTGARVIYFQTALIYGNNPAIQIADSVSMGTTRSVVAPWPLRTDQPANPENSYAISKYAGEQYLRHSGVPLLVFRLANIYGPRNLSGPVPTFYKRITAGEQCVISKTRRDFVYISDLCDLVMQAIKADATGTYHVSTGRDLPIGQVYDAVIGALDAYAYPEPEYVEPGPDDAPTILLDPTETKRAFGWEATTDIDEGVEHAVEWYRQHGVTDTYTHLSIKG